MSMPAPRDDHESLSGGSAPPPAVAASAASGLAAAARQPLPGWVASPARNPNLIWAAIAIAQAVVVLVLLGVFAGWGWFVLLTLPLWAAHTVNVYLGGGFHESPHHLLERVRTVRAATAPGAPPLAPIVPTPSPVMRRNLIINGGALAALLLGSVLWWSTAGDGSGGGLLDTTCNDYVHMRSDRQAQILMALDDQQKVNFYLYIDRCAVDPNLTLKSIVNR
ncbi:hypothetical protein [Frankia sp. AiPs1]